MGHIQKSFKVEQKQKKEVKFYYFWRLVKMPILYYDNRQRKSKTESPRMDYKI